MVKRRLVVNARTRVSGGESVHANLLARFVVPLANVEHEANHARTR